MTENHRNEVSMAKTILNSRFPNCEIGIINRVKDNKVCMWVRAWEKGKKHEKGRNDGKSSNGFTIMVKAPVFRVFRSIIFP